MGLYIYVSTVFASLAGFTFGYDVGSMSGVTDMVGYRMTLNLSYNLVHGGENSSQSCNLQDDVETSTILGLIISLSSVGGLMGALAGGGLSDHLGRKPALILGGSVVALGALIHTSAVHLWMVLLCRFIGGVGLGVIYHVTPIYVGEIAPEHVRGRLLSLLNTLACIGYLFGIVLNIFIKDLSYGWRISVSIEFLIGTVMALAMIVTPRSPRWLVMKKRDDEALKVLQHIYSCQSVAEEHLIAIRLTLSSNVMTLSKTVKYILQWRVLQRVLFGFAAFLLGRLTGGNFMGYFAVSIFCKIGLPGFVVSLALAGAVLVPMVASLTFIDKIGRKPLFLIGLTLMFCTYALSSLLIIKFDLGSIQSSERDESLKVVEYIVLILLSLNVGLFSLTCGNVTWIIMGELFPLPAKGFMIAICNSGFWIGLIVTNQLGSILINSALQVSGTLLLFSAVIVFLFLVVLFLMPETKGLSLEDVEKLYSKRWKDRVHVLYYMKCCCFVEFCKGRRTVEREVEPIEYIEDEIRLLSNASSADDLDTILVTSL